MTCRLGAHEPVAVGAALRDPGRARSRRSSPLTIDGKEVQAPRGELLIKVAQEHGTYIPRFCWHERMKPVGMCRMCLVEVEGMRGLQISCATPVADGMVVNTQSPTREGRAGRRARVPAHQPPARLPGVRPRRRVPAAGPDARVRSRRVALRRGEAPLREADPDQRPRAARPRALHPVRPLHAVRGRDRRRPAHRLRRPRRHHRGHHVPRRAVLVVLLRQHRADLPGRRAHRRARTGSGPGRGTSRRSRRRARRARSGAAARSRARRTGSCACSVSTPSRSTRAGSATRAATATSGCTRDERVRAPMVRKARRARRGVVARGARRRGRRPAARARRAGPSSIAVLGGARGTNEDAYVWARFAKGVLGTDNVDAQLGDGLPAEVVLGLPRATIADLDRARGRRARRARPQGGAAGPAPPGAPRRGRARGAGHRDRAARHRSHPRRRRGAAARAGRSGRDRRAARARARRRRHRVRAAGRSRRPSARSTVATATSSWCSVVSRWPSRRRRSCRPRPRWPRLPGVKFLSALRRGNVRGALDLGLTPGLPARPGHARRRPRALRRRVGLGPGAARPRHRRHPRGRGGRQHRHARAARRRPASTTSPTASACAPGSTACGSSIAVGAFAADAADRADVFLPTSVWGEKAGSTTNLEGRVQRLARLVTPEGTTMDDWRIAAELASRFGADFGLETVEEVQDEIARVAPAHAGVDAELLRRARDGAVAPDRRAPRRARVRSRVMGVTTGRSWEPIRPDRRREARRRRHRRGRARTGRRTIGSDGADRRVGSSDHRRRRQRCGAPAVYVWDRHGAGTGAVPPDAYSLRLVAARTLYDAGRIVSSSPSLAALAPGAALVVHPSDLDRIGVAAEGDDVRVTSRARHRHAAGRRPTPPPRRAPRSSRSPRAARSAPTTSSTSPPRSPSSAWRPLDEGRR